MFSVRSGARNEVESRSRASTWLKRRASGATPAATWRATRQEQVAAGVEYHLDYPSRWAIGKLAKSTRSIFSQLVSRIVRSGSAPSVLVSPFILNFSIPSSSHFVLSIRAAIFIFAFSDNLVAEKCSSLELMAIRVGGKMLHSGLILLLMGYSCF